MGFWRFGVPRLLFLGLARLFFLGGLGGAPPGVLGAWGYPAWGFFPVEFPVEIQNLTYDLKQGARSVRSHLAQAVFVQL